MNTVVWHVDPNQPDPHILEQAAALLRQNGLVAFPTETVYGLGADARSTAAVAGIFAAKGRPAHNPLIVHVTNSEEAQRLTSAWTPTAQVLAETFWPGGLSLVLPKADTVSNLVTANGPTVAVRVPAHPVALAFLQIAKCPVAAPSANRSNRLSPTRAEHVLEDLNGRIEGLIDGGPCPGGLESTVLDLTTEPPTLLRPGLIAPGKIEAIIGPIKRPAAKLGDEPTPQLRSPGQLSKHYAPDTQLEWATENGWQRVTELVRTGLRVGWLTTSDDQTQCHERVEKITVANNAEAFACQFYDALHRLDRAQVDRIIVDVPPVCDDWLAIHDRLRRASFNSDRA